MGAHIKKGERVAPSAIDRLAMAILCRPGQCIVYLVTLKLMWHDGPVSYLGPAFKLHELSRWLNRRPSVEIFCTRKEKKKSII